MSTPQWALDRIQEAKEKGLTSLKLSNGYLKEIPSAVFDLHMLRILDLRNNQLEILPEAITQLQNLSKLDLSRNWLTSLPESIVQLQNLTELDLRNNELTNLPASITRLQNLISLDLRYNYLSSPPQEVAEAGIQSIRQYFRQLVEQGQEKLYEAKLLILGEGGAGKTTLAKKIVDKNYQLQEEISTEGVDVTKWHFPLDDGKTFRVNLWDFGGQEIYHATHQFFLTKRSLYVLVADSRKVDTDFYYWLNVVELLSENSPLFIVNNEKQERQRELNERQLRGQFDNLKEVMVVNFSNNRGLERLKDAIQHYIKQLPHIGSSLPKSWVRVRERLEKDARNHISLQEYLTICQENGFTKEKDCLQLSSYLNDIGVFLHFQDEPLLNRTVILKPKWGTDAVYKVLDNKIVIKNNGRFTRNHLNNIWGTPEYATMRDELLQLMMKFKLCYEIPGEKGIYIAPQLLSENQPYYDWNENYNLLIRYDYEFMPKGILLQLIVALNKMIWGQTVWRSGVLIEKDKTRAEVIELYDRRQIRVRVVGMHKKELMTIVLHELDKIHATYKRLKYDKLIPCNCVECLENSEPYFYKYQQLQNFIEKYVPEIQCGVTGNMLNVRSLIDDVLERKTGNDEQQGMPAQYVININQGEKKVADNKISITNSTIHGSVIAAESIKDSFNMIQNASIKDDLKEQLQQLTRAVESMIQNLPKEQAEEVADAMQVLTKEAVKPAPRKEWYSISIDGLTKAAENLGKVGEPVLKLAAKVSALLMGMGS